MNASGPNRNVYGNADPQPPQPKPMPDRRRMPSRSMRGSVRGSPMQRGRGGPPARGRGGPVRGPNVSRQPPPVQQPPQNLPNGGGMNGAPQMPNRNNRGRGSSRGRGSRMP